MSFLLPVEKGINDEKQHQQYSGSGQHVRQYVRCNPEEWDVVEKPEEKRGVAQRRERTAYICDKKYKKTDNMRLLQTIFIRPENRPYHNHGCPCCAHTGCQNCAYQQHDCIDCRGAFQ